MYIGMPALKNHPGAIALSLPELGSEENLILFRQDVEINEERFLDWIPMLSFYTAELAKIHDVSYTGPSEEVLHKILEHFRDVFV